MRDDKSTISSRRLAVLSHFYRLKCVSVRRAVKALGAAVLLGDDPPCVPDTPEMRESICLDCHQQIGR